MSPILPSPPRPRRRLGGVVALFAALMLALSLLASPSDAVAAKRSEPDIPNFPKNCYGPAQVGVAPFPCPLLRHRKGRPTIVLWGDSHAYMYIPALREVARAAKFNLVSYVGGGCPPAYVNPNKNRLLTCERSNIAAYKKVRNWQRKGRNFKVILGSNWSGFRIAYRRLMLDDIVPVTDYSEHTKRMVRISHRGTPRLFKKLGKLGVSVDVIGPSAVVPEIRSSCAAGEEPYRCNLPRWRALPEEDATNAWLRRQMKRLKGNPKLIDTSSGYCSSSVCRGVKGGVSTWYDDLHLSATRTRKLSRFFTVTTKSLKRRAR